MKYGVVQRPKRGRDVSGDAYLIKELGSSTLVCLADGLGSGPVAAEAAGLAIQCVERYSTLAIAEILKQCHRALKGTRGAVLALLRVDDDKEQVSFVGVGNITFHARSAHPMKPISRNGIVGHRLPNPREFRYRYTPGDLFVLHSDGVSSRFNLDDTSTTIDVAAEPQALAEELVRRFGKDTDDVTLIVLR